MKVVHPDSGYYSVIRTNELSSHEKRGANLKCTLLSERKQSEKANTVWF